MVSNGKICPNCKNTETVKRGFILTHTKGKQQRYFCKACKRKFIERDGFYRMRNSAQKITICLDLFYRGVSTRKIQEHLQAFYPHNASHVSVYKWLLKYSCMISKFTDGLSLNVGLETQIDEMEYKALGQPCWFIDSVDTTTRFLISAKLAKMRSGSEIEDVLGVVKGKTGDQIKIITTDAYNAYEKAVKRTFVYNNHIRAWNVNHNVVTARKGEGFNYPIERLHNSIRERTKTFRGFHGSVESAAMLMKGYVIFYNFIRKHQGIGCRPCELAVPDLKLNVENRWLELIGLANKGI